MADPAVANILKSNAVLWIAPEGEAFPDETTIAAGAAWGGNWTRLGYTKEPLVFAYEDERHNVDVEEVLMTIRRHRISEESRMETTLSELIGDYLKYATEGALTTTAAGASQKAFEELLFGDDANLTVYTVGFEGIAYNANAVALPIRIGYYRCNVKLNGELEFSKKNDDHTGVPIQIMALGRTDGGRPIWLNRVTAPASS